MALSPLSFRQSPFQECVRCFAALPVPCLQLNEVPVPKPGKGEVLVKVRAASVNPADYHLQSGRLRPFLPARLPFTPGQ